MTIVANVSPPTSRTVSVSIGMCAYNERRRIGAALESLLAQECPAGLEIGEVLVIASGCTDGTEEVVETWSRADSRVKLVAQPLRQGKASAINAFLGRALGEILVLLNADARLPEGSLRALLQPFVGNTDQGIACGLPVPETDSPALVRLFAESQWGLHNRALETLSRLRMPNHCCDEFLAMRRGFVTSIPPEVINDGAYLALVAERRGSTVRVCPDAPVFVEVPHTLRGALMQRRRILRGHRQIHELLARPTNTLEALLFRDPSVVVGTVREEFLRSPAAFLRFLLLLLPIEILANLMAEMDRIRSVAYEPAWAVVD